MRLEKVGSKNEEVQRASDFQERKHLRVENFEYSREGSDPGLVMIFNQEKFQNWKERAGSTRDTNEIILCLQRHGYNICADDIRTNYTTQKIKYQLNEGNLFIFQIIFC